MPRPTSPIVIEKDLRLAVVCYGGISLAVYQHGITKELLKLVRASAACQNELDPTREGDGGPEFGNGPENDTQADTESVYCDLLREIRRNNLDLRIIVDVIAGSSAGGINGVVLARAIAHDLPIEPLTNMWLANADIARVLAADAKARFWHKWYVRPFVRPLIWLLSRKRMLPSRLDRETVTKLSLFLRSRWFQPPFDGQGFCNLLLDALGVMGEPRASTASLMPAGHRLDLLVTATDFGGTERSIYIHDPPIVREREHRHIFRFSFEQFKGGAVQTDFDLYNVPSLAFAARATASFPGAFPPVQIREMDAALNARRQSWPAREQFLHTNFRNYQEFGMNPEQAVFVDGSVLNNKPVFEAIEAASSHVAFRDVDRRLIYIDPHPGETKRPTLDSAPGFIQTIAGALSELPRYEPIFGELSLIEVFNANVGRVQEAITAATPRVRVLIRQVTGPLVDQAADAAQIRKWRRQVVRIISTEERLLYNNYMQLMIGAALEYLTQLVCSICAHPQGSPRAHWVSRVLKIWAHQADIYREAYEFAPDPGGDMEPPRFARFPESFDLSFRRRRIRLVMRTINRLYSRLGRAGGVSASPIALDSLKRRFYRQLDALREYQKNDFLRGETMSHAQALFGRPLAIIQSETLPDPDTFVALNIHEISAIIEQIGLECDFARFTSETDGIIGSVDVQAMDGEVRCEIIETYLGFELWDAVSLPMISLRYAHEALQLTELQEIVVDRISPDDVTAFGDRKAVLKGGDFGGFAGFFSRAARENDYLWGRLHAIDRLLSIVSSSVAEDMLEKFDIARFRERAFEIVLQSELTRLPNVRDLISELQASVLTK